MQTPLFLGIDGGGTRCRARLCDAEGKRLGEGFAGSANTRLGLTQAFTEIIAASEQALVAAGLSKDAIGQLHAGLGLAGLALQSERDRLDQFPHPFASAVAETDAHIACLGAHNGNDGAILILGTGSCGCGIVQGKTFTVGGWGFQISDQGSGAILGQTALREALWAFEGMRPVTALSQAVMARFDNRPEQIVLWADRAKPRDYSALATLVFEYAAASDPLAQRLVNQAAEAAAALIQRLIEHGAPRVALLGGLSAPLTPYLPGNLQTVLVTPAGDALDGAQLMVRQRYQQEGHDVIG